MSYNTIKISVFVIFLHSIRCTSTIDSVNGNVSAIVEKAKAVNVYNDTSVLYKCLTGTDEDDESIARVMIERSSAERVKIRKLFELLYEKDILVEIRHRIYNNFRRIVIALFFAPYDYYAQELYQATLGVGTDEEAITEILVPMNNSDILQVCAAYKKAIGRTLLEDLSDDTMGQYWKLLQALVSASRDESGKVDYAAADSDSNDLIKATEGRKGHSKVEPVIKILTSRSYPQLKVIFEAYKNKTNREIWDSIEYFYTGADIQYAFLFMVKCVYLSTDEIYAGLLRDALNGVGTNDLRLIRIIVSRSEIDLGAIKKTYKAMYGTSLADDIADDTSGLYCDVLLGLINKV